MSEIAAPRGAAEVCPNPEILAPHRHASECETEITTKDPGAGAPPAARRLDAGEGIQDAGEGIQDAVVLEDIERTF